jgi:diacylglycerol kinase (ATP)
LKKYKVILNPVAGHGNGLKSLPALTHLLAVQGLDYDLAQTEGVGHALELARGAAAAGYDVIVAAGGDGTVNEVVNALMEVRQSGSPPPALGVLCVGRGNDLAYSLGIPVELEAACRALAEDRRRWIDIGRLASGVDEQNQLVPLLGKIPQGRYFANCVGIGFDAIVTIEVAKLPRWGGFASFLVGIFKTVFLYNRAPLAAIEFNDQKIVQRSLMISIMNGRQLGGGGFIMAPHSQPDDGMLDLCIAEQMGALAVFRMVPYFAKGTQATQPRIKMARTSRLSVTAQDGPLPAHTDGEIICTEGKRLEVELYPRQLEVICKIGTPPE